MKIDPETEISKIIDVYYQRKEKSDGSVCFFACVVVELQMFDNLTLKKKSTSDRAVQRKSGW